MHTCTKTPSVLYYIEIPISIKEVTSYTKKYIIDSRIRVVLLFKSF